MKKLVQEKNPNLIICTHSLPAYMLNHLKRKKYIDVPVINVYTDYFVHRFWGIEHIDFHFVPTLQVKKFLMEKGVNKEKIFITGIPIHSTIRKQKQPKLPSSKKAFTILVSGGNLGVGAMDDLIEEIKTPLAPESVNFFVLCGKNKKLFEKLNNLKLKHITPYPYINCMKEMNNIYEKVDAIITKPGGVTVSECLFKRKPIFIFHTLPGQEKINMEELEGNGLVFLLKKSNICEQILNVLQEKRELEEYHKRVDMFHSNLNPTEPGDIISQLIEQ